MICFDEQLAESLDGCGAVRGHGVEAAFARAPQDNEIVPLLWKFACDSTKCMERLMEPVYESLRLTDEA